MKNKCYHGILTMVFGMVVHNFFPFYLLADPEGREIAKYGYFSSFWPRTAFSTWKNPGRGLKTEKRNFLALGVPKSKTKVNTLSGMVVRNFFLHFTFRPTGPPRLGNRKIWVF